MIPASAYSRLLETLYAAALDETQWKRFLEQLCALTGSRVALALDNSSSRGIQRLATNVTEVREDIDAAYRASYRYTDPVRVAFMRNPRLGVIEVEELIPFEEWSQTEVFRTVAIPRGCIHGTLLSLSISTRGQECITIWRGEGSRWLAPEHKELLEMLFPHLQNVFRIRRTLALSEARASTAEAMLDVSAAAAILLDETGSLLHMNQAAQRLTGASDGLTIANHRVTPTDPAQRSNFAAMVAACATDASTPSGALQLARGSRRRPLQVMVTPLRVTEQEAVRALILASDPDQGTVFPDAILRQLYGFTPAETEVANGLLTGFSPEEIAQVRRVSIATVRAQLRSMLAKTDTRRQSELVRLIATLPLPPAK